MCHLRQALAWEDDIHADPERDGHNVIYNPNRYQSMPVGIVLRRAPGVTRWAKWVWTATAVLPGAAEARWLLMRQEGDVCEYHAATLLLELHGAEAEGYLQGLTSAIPSLYVVLRTGEDAAEAPDDCPFAPLLVTASPYEAQDYADSGEEIVEKVPMPHGLVAWVRDFALEHHEEEVFKKRRRDTSRVDAVEDGIGDARIAQMVDVYRAPSLVKKERLQ